MSRKFGKKSSEAEMPFCTGKMKKVTYTEGSSITKHRRAPGKNPALSYCWLPRLWCYYNKRDTGTKAYNWKSAKTNRRAASPDK